MLLHQVFVSMQEALKIHFPEGSAATAFRPDATAELGTLLQPIGMQRPHPVIVVIGGASQLQQYHIARLRSLFINVLAPLAESLGAIVVDGGTDTGVMRMMGDARQKTQSSFPLVGVLPEGTAALPGLPAPSEEAAALEPHHTHFVLVPGNQWGDESPWIAEIATVLAQGLPSVTILINGGEITWKDAAASVDAGRPIIAVSGSGRAADDLVSALNGTVTDDRARAIVASGLLQAVDLESASTLESQIRQVLSASRSSV